VSRHTLGSLLVAGLALSWGVIGVIVRELPIPPLTIVAFRVALSALSVVAILVALRRWELLRPPPWPVFALGALLALHWGLYFVAIKETSVASAVLITYSAPILMALLAPALIGERVPRVSVIALGVSAVGIAVISLAGGSGAEAVRPLGVALAVGAAISMALLVVLLKLYADRDPINVVVYLDGTATALLWPALVIPEYTVSAASWGYLLLLGVVLTGWSGLLYLLALRWVPATTVGILSYMEPVSAALLAALLLGESLTLAVMIGGAAIVAAGVAVVVASDDPVAASVEEPVPARTDVVRDRQAVGAGPGRRS